MNNSTKYKEINGKGHYYCDACKKWKPVYYIPDKDYNKLPEKYKGDTTTICLDCYKKLTGNYNVIVTSDPMGSGMPTNMNFGKEHILKFLK